MWNDKEESQVCYWADYVTLPFDHTHNLDLEFPSSQLSGVTSDVGTPSTYLVLYDA